MLNTGGTDVGSFSHLQNAIVERWMETALEEDPTPVRQVF